jgi:prevent-host-death family protein
MQAFSTTALSRKIGDVVAAALRTPVTLTQHGKPRLVIMSIEEYDRLQAAKPAEDRTVGRLRDTARSLAGDFAAAAQGYQDGDEG